MKYLVIKMPDNWIEHEQLESQIKFSLQNGIINGADIVNDFIVTLECDKAIERERENKDSIKFIKRQIATEIGLYLLNRDLIKFKRDIDKNVSYYRASVDIINNKDF